MGVIFELWLIITVLSMELIFIDNYQCPGKTNAGHNYLRYQKSRSSLILGIDVVNKISKFFIRI